MRNVFGWDYPPGAANDPEAPYNQTDEEDDENADVIPDEHEEPKNAGDCPY